MMKAIRRARAWARTAPRYTGEYVFGPPVGEPLVLGVFGDSVGCGLGVTDVTRTFAGVLAGRLAVDRRVICRIAAVSGAQAPGLLEQRIVGDEGLAAISIGTNDLLHGATLGRFETGLGAFLDRLRSVPRVFVLGPGNVAAAELFPAALRPLLRRRMLAWEGSMRALVARFPNARHVGPSDAGELTRAHFAEDGFHPGDLGHVHLGELVYRRL